MIPREPRTRNASCSSVFPNIIGGVMRRNHKMLVALLAGSLSLAGTVATVGVLSASDLFSEQPMAQQAPPEQAPPAQPTLALTPAEPRNPAAENPVPGQPAVSPPAAMTFDREEAQGVLGREVRSAADENMGRIIDVIVDRAGTVRAAVIDFGGFLGVGSRKIAVDWTALHFTAVDGKDRITVGFTKDQVKAAPEYQDGKSIIVLSALGGPGRFRVTTSENPEK